MKRFALSFGALWFIGSLQAQNFHEYFADKTLRVDYLFTGNSQQQSIYLDELSSLPTWAGRRHHLDKLPLAGNGQIVMRDAATQTVIYKTSFSSLFQDFFLSGVF